MNGPDHALRLARAPELLRGYPPGTAEAAGEFLRNGNRLAFHQLIAGVLTHHLPPQPERPPVDTLPASAHLVTDVGLDSLALVELTFLLDELLGVKFSDDELRALQTLGELRSAILAKHRSA